MVHPNYLYMLADITIPVSRKYKEVVATKIATTT